ncbi:MAG: hypothetical protein AVDCRST_MAG85-3370 [uncultured Solirubrobacteraceae bacterium]|uniref:Glycosyltransferase 2-like domain-containing protein n=1 Tax=uncultured Solirubrobacteraceae bacterium TaxID=1162706 RepID=A0A6J4TML2_9ACTN|nr:MAG: hypothetical protein AVDCRST_MAG85-3370 [uncultured Solirubrobacteraceae bacterium]
MPGPPSVSIVILATREDHTTRCLRALAATAAPEIATETIVVANAEGDGLCSLVQRVAPEATVLAPPANTGTMVGWNLGFERARAPWLLWLHEDTEPRPGWLRSLLRTSRRPERPGVVSSTLLAPGGRSGGFVLWKDGTVSEIDDESAPQIMARSEPYSVDYGTACTLVERDLWAAIGGFDERFFPAMYGDADLALAAWRHGRLVMVDPGSAVVHHSNAMVRPEGGVSTSLLFKQFLAERNLVRFAAKWSSALAERPARPQGPPSQADVVGACDGRRPPGPAPAPAADRSLTGGPPEGLEVRLVRAEVAVQREFADWLRTWHVVELEREREAAHAELARNDAGFRARLAAHEQAVSEELARKDRSFRAQLDELASDREHLVARIAELGG